jgi:demethylmenaquinone methyltransferase / 2-methoxy-6-polyprenyl-1,4-benzoquinol methylase
MAPKSSYTRFKFEGQFIKGYDAFNHIATLGLDLWWRWKTARIMRQDLNGMTASLAVLDLACGTGDMSRAILKALPQAYVVGSDPSGTMIDHGREKLAPWSGRHAMVRAVSQLPFPDSVFSAISCAFGVRNFVHVADDVHESLRLLRPGGRLYVLEFFVPQNLLSKAVLKAYNALVFPFLGFLLTGRIGPYRYLFNSIFAFKTVPDFSALLTQAGFSGIRVKRFFFGMVHLVSGCKP